MAAISNPANAYSILARAIRLLARSAASLTLVVASVIPDMVARQAHAAEPRDRERPGQVRTIAQDARGATFDIVPGPARFDTVAVDGASYFRVGMPGAVVLEAPGKPSLPTLTLHVAIPERMTPRLAIAAEAWDDRPGPPPLPVTHERFVSDDPRTGLVRQYGTTPEPGIYRGEAAYPASAAAMGTGAMVGEWWIAPVHVRPVRWDPRSASYRVLRSMTLRVDFVPAGERELAARAASRPGAQAKVWDRVQRGLVKNYDAARAFPASPSGGGARTRGGVGEPSGGAAALGRARIAVNPEWKIAVRQTGWVSVSYATLAASGFPSGIAINTVLVEERGYDDAADVPAATPIPVVARDNNGNGLFDAGDAVTFHARSIRDRYGLGSIENRYTDDNVYWLTWGAGAAPVPGSVSGDIPGPATVASSFRDVIRLDVNQLIFASPAPDAASPPEAVEHQFWTNGDEPDFETTIPFQDPDPSQPFRIRSRYQGKNGSTHILDLFFRGASGVTDTLSLDETFFHQDVLVFDSGFTIPGSRIGGANVYRHAGERVLSSGFTVPGSAAFLDVIEATYSRRFRAVSGGLRFTSGGSGGVVEVRVANFPTPQIEVYDVTDPLSPLRVAGVIVAPAGGAFEASFRTDATAGERRFVAFSVGSELTVGAGLVRQDLPSNLRAPGAFGPASAARAVLIAPSEFLAAATRLADYRRAQGYVVEVAAMEDVLDEFNGGVKSARAIRRYLRHAYLAWTPRPAFAVLAGDASMDYERATPGSGVDWVPTYLGFEPITGPPGRELVAQDAYYVMNLAAPLPAESDYVPSMFLGRVPASSAGELDAYVTKVIDYESYGPSDSWRGRQLLVSDDEFSSTIFFSAGYCRQPQEAQFRLANQYMADAAASGSGSTDLRSDLWDLKTHTDALASTCQAGDPNCRFLGCVANGLRTIGGGVDQFVQEVSLGALILNFQTHANRWLIAHEWLFCSSPLGGCQSSDYDRISNYGKPAYLMVWGCHSNQFPDGPISTTGAVDSTDALGEQWMMLPDRGSIASFGSSAYEFLQTNAVYNEFVADAFFRTPPAQDQPPADGRLESRWIVGEVMGQAAVRNALTGFSIQQVMNWTLNLLGDPMLRMDALPPRIFDVDVAGAPFADNAPLTTDSPTDSLSLLAQLRDEVGIDSVFLVERDAGSGAVTPVDPATYSVSFSDSSRTASLAGSIRPHVGNYDLQIRATDINGRLRFFSMQVRTPIRYRANGVEILDNVFVEAGSRVQAEVTSPIPLTADSLALVLDGNVIPSVKTQTDAAGRQWTLESAQPIDIAGTHLIQVAIGARTAGLDQRVFQMTTEFTVRGVAVVDPRVRGAGCGGSVFQYELSATARKVELLIHSVSGRRVASIPVPGQAGFNVYCWDGRDSQAHDTAQGVYLYRLLATDTSGRTVSREGRMIRSR